MYFLIDSSGVKGRDFGDGKRHGAERCSNAAFDPQWNHMVSRRCFANSFGVTSFRKTGGGGRGGKLRNQKAESGSPRGRPKGLPLQSGADAPHSISRTGDVVRLGSPQVKSPLRSGGFGLRQFSGCEGAGDEEVLDAAGGVAEAFEGSGGKAARDKRLDGAGAIGRRGDGGFGVVEVHG